MLHTIADRATHSGVETACNSGSISQQAERALVWVGLGLPAFSGVPAEQIECMDIGAPQSLWMPLHSHHGFSIDLDTLGQMTSAA